MTVPAIPAFDPVDYGIKLIEEERRRIARDLHDGPAQDLTNISMRLSVVQRLMQSDPEMALTELERTNSRIVAAINDVRRLIYDLRPVAIDEIGLVSAAIQLCRRCERDWQIPFDMQTDSTADAGIVAARQIAAYRLLQEILQNVHKHAQATSVRVCIQREQEDIVIEVQDNGRGFDPNHISDGRFGIVGVKERSEYLGGHIHIDSSCGHGSVFRISIPVSQSVASS